MRYISLFSGIEAASVAWHDMGWDPVVFADIDEFPSAVLAYHYPQTENVGDVMKHEWKQYKGKADVIVGGSPCQSFSVAGQRLGMDDPRGNLALHFLKIIREVQPRWFIYENVPGLLSSGGGQDFATFLGEVAECGYGFAYRVLDAQYFGVPQRRRRIFVVGHIDGDWRSAAAVLFERESLCRDSKKGEQEGQKTTLFTSTGVGGTGEDLRRRMNQDKGIVHSADLAPTMTNGNSFPHAATGNARTEHDGLVVQDKGIIHCAKVGPAMGASGPPYSRTGNERVEDEALVVQQAPMHDPSPTLDASYGVGAGMRAGIERQVIGAAIPIHAKAVSHKGGGDRGQNSTNPDSGVQNGLGVGKDGEPMNTLDTACNHAVFQHEKQTFWNGEDTTASLTTRCHDQFMPDKDNFMAVISPQSQSYSRGGHGTFTENDEKTGVLTAHQAKDPDTLITTSHVVRRLTPVECERLQGFPDDYTKIPFKGKSREDCAKSHRYKALGNSMAVPVMKWIGERIQKVSDIVDDLEDRPEPKNTVQKTLW